NFASCDATRRAPARRGRNTAKDGLLARLGKRERLVPHYLDRRLQSPLSAATLFELSLSRSSPGVIESRSSPWKGANDETLTRDLHDIGPVDDRHAGHSSASAKPTTRHELGHYGQPIRKALARVR